MASIDIAVTYGAEALSRFTTGSLTAAAMQGRYSWDGAKSVVIQQVNLATAGDYVRGSLTGFSNSSASGQSTAQTMTLSKDRGLQLIIDKRSAAESGLEVAAAQFLAEQLEQVVAPEVDEYRFATIADACPTGQISATGAVTSANAYTKFLAGSEKMDELKVPPAGRVAFVTPAFGNLLKIDPLFTKNSDMGQAMLINGQIGSVDGIAIVRVPSTMMPSDTPFMIVHKDAVAAPIALLDARIHEDPVGVSGSVIEIRWCYDAFLLDGRDGGVYVCKTA